jgi:hypothetical protein
MLIKLLPQRRDDTLQVIKAGNVLTINGEVFDLRPMSEGSTLPRTAILSEWFPGDITMQDGEITLTLLLPLPANYSPDQAFPANLTNVPDGAVVLPSPLPEQPAHEVAPE